MTVQTAVRVGARHITQRPRPQPRLHSTAGLKHQNQPVVRTPLKTPLAIPTDYWQDVSQMSHGFLPYGLWETKIWFELRQPAHRPLRDAAHSQSKHAKGLANMAAAMRRQLGL